MSRTFLAVVLMLATAAALKDLGAELLVSPITPLRIVEAIALAGVRPSGSDTVVASSSKGVRPTGSDTTPA